jgi:hypothetical protein
MNRKLSFKINSIRLIEIGDSEYNSLFEDFSWREFILFTPIVTLNRGERNEFEEAYSMYRLSMPTVIEFAREPGIFWMFTIQVLGFGIQFFVQTGY